MNTVCGFFETNGVMLSTVLHLFMASTHINPFNLERIGIFNQLISMLLAPLCYFILIQSFIPFLVVNNPSLFERPIGPTFVRVLLIL